MSAGPTNHSACCKVPSTARLHPQGLACPGDRPAVGLCLSRIARSALPSRTPKGLSGAIEILPSALLSLGTDEICQQLSPSRIRFHLQGVSSSRAANVSRHGNRVRTAGVYSGISAQTDRQPQTWAWRLGDPPGRALNCPPLRGPCADWPCRVNLGRDYVLVGDISFADITTLRIYL